MEKNTDMVNRPPHYKKHIATLEPIDVLEYLTFNLGNAFKYLIRAKDKGNELQDLKKSEWYFQRATRRGEVDELKPKTLLLLSLYFKHQKQVFKVGEYRYDYFEPDAIIGNMRRYIQFRIEELEEKE